MGAHHLVTARMQMSNSLEGSARLQRLRVQQSQSINLKKKKQCSIPDAEKNYLFV